MPRIAREISSTDLYHVIMRGINQEYIFEKNMYKRKITQIIKEKLEDVSIEIYGYCIMDNHIHLLLKAESNEFSNFMTKVNGTYAIHYNYIQNRSGYVFQNRFKSYPIENEKSFWACLRYIHNNPVKAKLSKTPQLYNWSSYLGYMNKNDLLLHDKAYTLLNRNFTDIKSFMKFHQEDDYTLYPDIKEDSNIIKNLISEHVIQITLDKYSLNNSLELYTNKVALKYLKDELHIQAKLLNSEINEFLLKYDENE